MFYNVSRCKLVFVSSQLTIADVERGDRMARTAALGLRIEPVVKEALEKAAKADRRTVASYVENLIVADLEAKGLLTQQPD